MISTVKPNLALSLALSLVLGLLLGLRAAPLQAGAMFERGPVHMESVHLEHASPRFAHTQGKSGVSRDQAAAIVKKRYGGKILAVSETNRGGRSVYRVKGLSDKSQVYVVYVDKQSGRISR